MYPNTPQSLPTPMEQINRARNVNAQNTAAPQSPTPQAPSMPKTLLPGGSSNTTGTPQSQLALARPAPGNGGAVPMPPNMRQPQQSRPAQLQQMIQNLGASRVQNPAMMQTVLGMLGPQVSAPPSLASLMQPRS